jgi:hypothetical protein
MHMDKKAHCTERCAREGEREFEGKYITVDISTEERGMMFFSMGGKHVFLRFARGAALCCLTEQLAILF